MKRKFKYVGVLLMALPVGGSALAQQTESEDASSKPILDLFEGLPFEIRTEVRQLKKVEGRVRVQVDAELYNAGDIAVRTQRNLRFLWDIVKWPRGSIPTGQYGWGRDTTWTLIDTQVYTLAALSPEDITLGPGARHPVIQNGEREVDLEPGAYEITLQVRAYTNKGPFMLATRPIGIEIKKDLSLQVSGVNQDR